MENNDTFYEYLVDFGLSFQEAKIYDLLLRRGISKAKTLSELSEIKIGSTYKAIEELQAKNLCEKYEKDGKVTMFSPLSPSGLGELLDKEKTDLELKISLHETMGPRLLSQFNLVQDKPNVRFFEGKEGALTVAKDTLSSREIILQYLDSKQLLKTSSKENQINRDARMKKGIKKLILMPDTDFSRERSTLIKNDLTEVRFVKHTDSFKSIMQIYDNKISYITLEETNIVGVIIEDKRIYEVHRDLFMSAWMQATED